MKKQFIWLEVIGIIFILLMVLFLFIAMPFALIWALNTLFKITIEYNTINWIASFVLCVFLSNFNYKKGTK